MSKSHNKLDNDLKKQSLKGLLSLAGVADNDGTTTQIAVKPYRHTLAIFMPKNRGITTPRLPQGIDTQRHILDMLTFQHIPNYGGLIRPNTIAFMVNKSSRLFAVVETRHPLIVGGNNTTKQIGGNVPAPTYTPHPYEIQHGKIKDGVFWLPFFELCKNGKSIEPMGGCECYPYAKAFHILMHLQAVSDDTFSLSPVMWQPRTDVDISELLDNPFNQMAVQP